MPVSSTESEAPVEAGEGVISASPAEDVIVESSPAEGVEKSYLEVVTEALGGGSEESPASGNGEEKSSSKPEVESSEDDITEDEIKRYPPNSQRRIRQLLGRRDDLQTQIGSLEGELGALKPKAEHLDRITGWMEQHGISAQEFDNTLELTRLIKAGEHEKALEVLAPIVNDLARRAGRILPDDLKEDVRLGHISEQRARELHEARTRAANVSERAEQDRKRSEDQAERDRVQRMVTTAAKAGDDWAKAKAASDPDWNLKQDLVAEQVELEIQRNRDAFPKTAEEAVALAEKALKVVEERLKKFAPKPTERRAPTSQPVSPQSAATPKTYMEAVEMALASAGG